MTLPILPDPQIPALGVRQPWAELIVSGAKMIEVRSQPTHVRGTIYIYASQKFSEHPDAMSVLTRHDMSPDQLPRGVVIGSVDLEHCDKAVPEQAELACLSATALDGQYAWYLSNPQRFIEPLTVRFFPYGVWFYPWNRKNPGRRRK